MRTLTLIVLVAASASASLAQSNDNSTTLTPFDACGTIVRGDKCFLFSGGGGMYFVDASEFGNHQEGDAVRVTGSLVASCRNICGDNTDGCIQGAQVYDPAQLPCGTPIPSLPGDLYSSLCTAATGALTGALGAGFLLVRPRGRRTPD